VSSLKLLYFRQCLTYHRLGSDSLCRKRRRASDTWGAKSGWRLWAVDYSICKCPVQRSLDCQDWQGLPGLRHRRFFDSNLYFAQQPFIPLLLLWRPTSQKEHKHPCQLQTTRKFPCPSGGVRAAG
ncbi:hypothetical protein LEMLEM_LOCUS18823, partial [Lemmus lemmus]